MDVDALRYELDLLKAQRLSPPHETAWDEIQRRIKENRERANTDEFRNPLADLCDHLDKHFDLAELGELAFNLNLNLEKISSVEATKWDIIIDLVNHFQRRDRLDILVGAADGARPGIERPFSEFVGVV